jgi:iron complex outermembrane receptor protein
MKTGQSFARVGHAFWNSVVPLRGNADLYTFGGVSHRDGRATGFYRLPNSTARVVPELYPNGFLPEIHTQITDASVAGGIRGSRGGWDMDLSVVHGMEKFQFNIENSNNASMGGSSPVSFDAGGFEFSQTTGNFDVIKLLDTGGAARSVSLVAGSEFRLENYQIVAVEDASWQLGNGGDVPGVDFDTLPGGAPKAAGSQVFPGFQPTNELDRFRNSVAIYAGLETEFTDRFLIDVGGRFESYDDFGQTWTGKIATRLALAEDFAVRAAVSNGFRAPSLHQAWFNNVSTQFVIDAATGELTPQQVLTSNNISTVTKAFGVPDLKEETSINASAGFTARPGENFSISADFYHIKIDDRIVLTSRFTDSDPIVAGILAPFSSLGISQAQFFANAVDTKTNGLDIVASYAMPVGAEGTLNLTASANFTDTEVDATNVPAEMAQIFAGGDLDAVKSTLFNREERNRLEDALPHQKIAGSARWESGRWSALARVTHFGKVEYKPTSSDNDETFDAKTLLDVDLGIELMPGVRWTVGANNVFDTFPDEHEKAGNRSSERFIYSRRVTQFGMNGGFYYTRLQLTL